MMLSVEWSALVEVVQIRVILESTPRLIPTSNGLRKRNLKLIIHLKQLNSLNQQLNSLKQQVNKLNQLSNRIGGRLQSISMAGGHVDLGAMWIHEGFAGNPLFDIAKAAGLALSPQQNYNSVAGYTVGGAKNSRTANLNVYRSWYAQLAPRVSRMRAAPGAAAGGAADLPVSTVFREWLASNLGFSAAEKGQANLLMHTQWQALLNGNVTALSTLRLGDAKTIPAIDVMLADGFAALADSLLAGAPGSRKIDIQFGAVATSVEHGADGVTVTTADGATYSAPHAILTPSLGVLKQGDIQFTPPLPQAKLRAIAEMGMGCFHKTVLSFDRVFWDAGADFILREMPDWSGRWSVFMNYAKLFPGMPVLVALHVADTARELEGMADAEVVAEGMAVLRSMYGGGAGAAAAAVVPDPLQTAVTRWHADPLTRGGYSFFAVGNPRNITDVLAEPVGRLLFAGEATSSKPATVLGAYLSGLREAQRLLGLLRPNTTSTTTSPTTIKPSSK